MTSADASIPKQGSRFHSPWRRGSRFCSTFQELDASPLTERFIRVFCPTQISSFNLHLPCCKAVPTLPPAAQKVPDEFPELALVRARVCSLSNVLQGKYYPHPDCPPAHQLWPTSSLKPEGTWPMSGV